MLPPLELLMTSKQFKKDLKFGNRLEKNHALKVIERIHPKCSIHEPEEFREDGLAVPDHIIKKGKKVVAFYDSKNKRETYKVNGHPERFWSVDEKLLEYRKYALKHKAPCYLLFYNKRSDKDNVYIVDVTVEPKFYKRINNRFGEHWYGYYISQTTPYTIE
jgi:hypothetical protein